METFLEIVKYTAPALIVFMTVYFIMKKYLDQQWAMENLKYKQAQSKDILPLKLQAYERLMLLCERISTPNLTYRVGVSDMNKDQLKSALIIAIQQEYEHNLTQQIYVSDSLWDIVTLAKNQTIELISKAADAMQAGDKPGMLIQRAEQFMAQMNMNPLDQARSAIKKEIDYII